MTYRQKLLLILLLKAFLSILLIHTSIIGLAPDEAQYWTWSQAPDWGYYSKPPAIAWQIGATTALFGNTVLGVRFGAVVWGFLLAWTIFFLGNRIGLSEKKSFWASLLLAFSPYGFFLSMMATTDPGAILFFTLGILAIVSGPHYLWAGVFILIGSLFKWTAFALWPFVLILLPFYPQLRKKSLIGGIALSLLALVPALYWNAFHEWATFKHVASTPSGGGNFFDFLASQIGLLSPVIFVLLICALVTFWKKRTFPLVVTAIIPTGVLIYLLLSIFSKMQPNWAFFLYPPAFILISWWSSPKWLQIGLWTSIAFILITLAIPYSPLPYKLNPFRQNLGWEKLAPALESAGYTSQDALIADKYQMASLLSFYGPEQKRAYFLNIHHRRKNQFSFWKPLPQGASGFFVMAENTTTPQGYSQEGLTSLAPYFEHVEFVGAYPLYKNVKYAFIFKCEGYNGKLPEESGKY